MTQSAAHLPAPLVHQTHTPAWSAYATQECSVERWQRIAADLHPYRSDPVVLARLAHLRMLCDDPADAVRMLRGIAHPLAQAQQLLARLQEARSMPAEVQRRVYIEVSVAPPYFNQGTADPLGMEAQMRLDYALSIAFVELGSSQAQDFLAKANHLGRMLGVRAMSLATSTAQASRDAQRSPVDRAFELALSATAAYEMGNERLAVHSAHEARDLLMDANAYARIPAICDLLTWLPQAALWRSAVYSLAPSNPLDELLTSAPLEQWALDPLVLTSHSYQSLVRSARDAGRLDYDGWRRHARHVLNLPAWPALGGRRMPEGIYRSLHILALLYAGNKAGATAAMSDAVDDRLHLTGEPARWYMGIAGLSLIGAGAAAPRNWPAAVAAEAARTAMSRLHHNDVTGLAHCTAHAAPSAVYVMGQGDDVSPGLRGVASDVVLLGTTAQRGGRKVPHCPRTLLGEPYEIIERGCASPHHKTIHRYRRAIMAEGEPPVAFEWWIERILSHLY